MFKKCLITILLFASYSGFGQLKLWQIQAAADSLQIPVTYNSGSGNLQKYHTLVGGDNVTITQTTGKDSIVIDAQTAPSYPNYIYSSVAPSDTSAIWIDTIATNTWDEWYYKKYVRSEWIDFAYFRPSTDEFVNKSRFNMNWGQSRQTGKSSDVENPGPATEQFGDRLPIDTSLNVLSQVYADSSWRVKIIGGPLLDNNDGLGKSTAMWFHLGKFEVAGYKARVRDLVYAFGGTSVKQYAISETPGGLMADFLVDYYDSRSGLSDKKPVLDEIRIKNGEKDFGQPADGVNNDTISTTEYISFLNEGLDTLESLGLYDPNYTIIKMDTPIVGGDLSEGIDSLKIVCANYPNCILINGIDVRHRELVKNDSVHETAMGQEVSAKNFYTNNAHYYNFEKEDSTLYKFDGTLYENRFLGLNDNLFTIQKETSDVPAVEYFRFSNNGNFLLKDSLNPTVEVEDLTNNNRVFFEAADDFAILGTKDPYPMRLYTDNRTVAQFNADGSIRNHLYGDNTFNETNPSSFPVFDGLGNVGEVKDTFFENLIKDLFNHGFHQNATVDIETNRIDINVDLSGYTETDPIFTASDAFAVTSAKISNWDTAFGWGDHAGLYVTENLFTSNGASPGARTFTIGGDFDIINDLGSYTFHDATSDFTITDGTTTFNIINFLGKTQLGSNDPLEIKANGSIEITIDNAGNVGVGETNPIEKLDVVGGIKLTDALNVSPQDGTIEYNTTLDTFQFWENGTVKYLGSSGGGSDGKSIYEGSDTLTENTTISTEGFYTEWRDASDNYNRIWSDGTMQMGASNGNTFFIDHAATTDIVKIGTSSDDDLEIQTNNNTRIKVDNAGDVEVVNDLVVTGGRALGMLYKTAEISDATGTVTKVDFNVLRFSEGGVTTDVTNDSIYIDVSGYYEVRIQADMDNTAASTVSKLELYENGSEVSQQIFTELKTTGTDDNTIASESIIEFTAGDYLDVRFSRHAGTGTAKADDIRFTVKRLIGF